MEVPSIGIHLPRAMRSKYHANQAFEKKLADQPDFLTQNGYKRPFKNFKSVLVCEKKGKKKKFITVLIPLVVLQ